MRFQHYKLYVVFRESSLTFVPHLLIALTLVSLTHTTLSYQHTLITNRDSNTGTCNELDGVMTTRYCNNNDGCGPIPPSLGMCSNLLDLTLSHGRLSSSIPNQLTQLVNLLNFDVSNNKLTGELPNDIGNLLNLTSLDVSNNNLDGYIPTSLSSLTSLEHLYLDNNYFDGEIQYDIFTSLTNLKELYLSFNMFQGAVPYLNNHNSLKSIMLHSNSFDKIRSDTFSGTVSLQYVVREYMNTLVK